MRSVYVMGAGLALLIAVMATVLYFHPSNTSRPKGYLYRHGYEINDIEWQVWQVSCYMGNKSKRYRYNFEGTRDGTPVKGFVCYGNIYSATIHE